MESKLRIFSIMSHYGRTWVIFLSLLFMGLDFPKFKTGEEQSLLDFRKGVIHYNTREYTLARESFYSALSKKSDFPLAKFYLFRSYYQSGDWLASQEVLRELIQEKPNDPVIRNRWEGLNLELAGTRPHTEDKVFYRSLSGEENRGYRFRNPVDLFLDQSGNLYVLGFNTTNLTSFNPNFEPRWNTQGGFFQKMKGPVSLFSWKENILVADYPTDSLFLFNTKGQFISRYGNTGSGLNQFRGPTAITRDSKGNFYISDSGNRRILKWNPDMQPMFEFGNRGEGQLSNPVNLTWHMDKLYVADKDNKRIVIFDEEGNYLAELNSPLFKKIRNIRFIDNVAFVSCETSGLLIQDKLSGSWSKFSPFQEKSGRLRNFDRPFGITKDRYGYFYVSDYSRHRVDIFAPKNFLLTNLHLEIDRIDNSDFPHIHLYLRLKNKMGQDITGLGRNDFLLTENQNTKQYFDVTNMKKFNQRLASVITFENSEDIIQDANRIRDWFEPFFRNVTYNDSLSLTRSGAISTTIMRKTYSLHDTFYNVRRSIPEKNINSGKAIYQGIGELAKELGSRSLIYIASGKEPVFTKQYNLPRLIQYARANGIAVFPVLLNPPGDEDDTWESLAEGTGGSIYLMKDSSNQLYNQSLENIDYRYVISFKTESLPSLTGRWIPLELQVRYRNFGGKTVGGYFVP